MLKLVIADKKYWLPVKQSEINWKTGKAVQQVVDEMGTDTIEAKKWLLATLIGTDYDIVDAVDDQQVEMVIDNHKFFSEEVRVFHHNFIKLNRKILGFRDFDTMTVRQYMEFELLALDDLHKDLFLALYEKLPWHKKIGKKIIARLLIKNSKTFDDLNYFRVRVAEYLYLEHKRKVMTDYGLLAQQLPDDQVDAEAPKTSRLEQFGLYHVMLEYSDNDPRIFDYWLDRNVTELFKYLLYMKIKILSQKA